MRVELLFVCFGVAAAFQAPLVLSDIRNRQGSGHTLHPSHIASRYSVAPIRRSSLAGAVRMATTEIETRDRQRDEAKKALIASCEEFRVAQLKLWAAEAVEEARIREEGKKGVAKDRLGGLFGAESLGTARMDIGEVGNRTLALALKMSELNPTPGSPHTKPLACACTHTHTQTHHTIQCRTLQCIQTEQI